MDELNTNSIQRKSAFVTKKEVVKILRISDSEYLTLIKHGVLKPLRARKYKTRRNEKKYFLRDEVDKYKRKNDGE
jgi:hypothetical protein